MKDSASTANMRAKVWPHCFTRGGFIRPVRTRWSTICPRCRCRSGDAEGGAFYAAGVGGSGRVGRPEISWIGGERVLCTVSPGGGWRSKCWPAERYGDLHREISSQLGLQGIVSFGPGEENLADEVAAASGLRAPIPLEMDLPHLMAALRRAKFLVAADTGPLHLASALGTPVVGLFGPTDPARNGPYGEPSIVVRKAEDGETTYKRGASYSPAMLRIEVSDVMAAIDRLWWRGNGVELLHALASARWISAGDFVSLPGVADAVRDCAGRSHCGRRAGRARRGGGPLAQARDVDNLGSLRLGTKSACTSGALCWPLDLPWQDIRFGPRSCSLDTSARSIRW